MNRVQHSHAKTGKFGAVSIRPNFGLLPIFFLIILNDPLCIGSVYANYFVEWSNCLEDIFKLSGWGNVSPNLTGYKHMHIQLYNYDIIL